jgi:hypothetical protein
MMIVNGDPSIINKFRYSLTDAARAVIYDRHMFILQATGFFVVKLFSLSLKKLNKLERLSLADLFSLA